MAASQKVNIPFSDDLEEEEDGVTMLDVVWGQLREVCAGDHEVTSPKK